MPRPAVIKGTEYEDLIQRLIAAQWSSNAIALYLDARYGYTVDASTIRRYRAQHAAEIADRYPDLAAAATERTYVESHVRSDEFVDVVGSLAELIHMQRQRLEIDLSLERNEFRKLLPDTRHEIRLMADMLDQYQRLLQDWGVVPKAELTMTLNVPHESAAVDVSEFEELPADDQEHVLDLALQLHRALPGG